MSAIFSGLYFLKADPELNAKAKEHLKTIHEAAQDMLNMINSSLCILKMEQGLYKPDYADVDAMELLNRIKKDLRVIAKAKDSSILTQNSTGIPNDDMTGFTVRGEQLLVYSMLGESYEKCTRGDASRRAGNRYTWHPAPGTRHRFASITWEPSPKRSETVYLKNL